MTNEASIGIWQHGRGSLWLDHVQLRKKPRFLKGSCAKKEGNVTDALKKLLDEMIYEMNHVFNYCRYEIK